MRVVGANVVCNPDTSERGKGTPGRAPRSREVPHGPGFAGERGEQQGSP